jgi:predicted nucleotidyltransferase
MPQALLIRTSGTPLRHLWAMAYRAIARITCGYLIRDEADAAAYLRGGLAVGDLLPGLSDIDLVVVVSEDSSGPGLAAARTRRRWRRVARLLRIVPLPLDVPRIYGDDDLRDLADNSALTYGLDASHPPVDRGTYFGDRANLDRIRTLGRPGLYGATGDWRLLAGSERRLPKSARDAQLRRVAAWFELVYWWRLVFPVCMTPTRYRAADMSVKFVAEPARIWLWLAHGERLYGRVEVLRAALQWLPEEESVIRRALDLRRSLPHCPDSPLAEAVPGLVRLSTRIAELISAQIADYEATDVRLQGLDPAELIIAPGSQPGVRAADLPQRSCLALADWRALACPPTPDESFTPTSGDPSDPVVLAAAAASQPTGPYPALRSDGLMILPGGPWWRTQLRAIQCRSTDPVSFSLAAGAETAVFPNVRGWSAQDVARRAVAEHRAWLAGEPNSLGASGESQARGRTLGMLMTAARAGLFLQSIEERAPELSLTVVETARQLAARSSAAGAVAEGAVEGYREFGLHGRQPAEPIISAMRKLVTGLPAYSRG